MVPDCKHGALGCAAHYIEPLKGLGGNEEFIREWLPEVGGVQSPR
jgi:hypothetical protein